jgi:hypothetical protein
MCSHRGYVQVELQGVRNELTKHALSGKVIDRLQVREPAHWDAIPVVNCTRGGCRV